MIDWRNVEWVLADPGEVFPACRAPRGKRSQTRCELPPDHMVGRLPGPPVREEYHTGRSRTGRWYSWPPEVAA